MLKRIIFLVAALIIFVPSLATASSSWQYVDTLTTNPTIGTSVAVDSQGVVYFAYAESADDGYWYVSIDKYEEGALSDLGSIRTYGEQIQLQIDSSDTPYLAYYAPNEGVVVKTLNGSSWDNVGNVGSQGIATTEEYPVNIQFAIAPDDTMYLAYGDDASSSSEVPSLIIHEYTGNTTSDTDGNENDGWEYALAPFYSNIGDFQFDVDENGVIYLVIDIDRSADISGATSVVYKTYAYKWSGSGWSSIWGDPYYPALQEFFIESNQDGFDLFDGTEVQRYVGISDSWTNLGNPASVAESDSTLTYRSYNYGYQEQGVSLVTDADNTLHYVFGNTDTNTQDWDNPWGSATVTMYNGSSWELIGSSRFSETSSMYFSLAITDDEYSMLCRDGVDGEAVLYTYDTTESTTSTDTSSSTAEETSATETPEPTNTTDATEQVAEETDEYGNSPVTGELEKISAVSPGQFIRSSSFNSIYYIETDGTRRPFWNANTFFTYADSFDEVIWVTDATLSTLTLGAPMLPKTGVVLAKIQSDPKVYAIDNNNTLRWVPDENTAITLFGSDWAEYVIDLEVTVYGRFSKGSDMTVNTSVNRNIMKKRFNLN